MEWKEYPSLYKDKDFSIYISPDLIHIYWNNFDDKQFDMSIPSTTLVDQNEIDNQELDVLWEDNDSVNAIKEILPLTINMHQYGGFEQTGLLIEIVNATK